MRDKVYLETVIYEQVGPNHHEISIYAFFSSGELVQ